MMNNEYYDYNYIVIPVTYPSYKKRDNSIYASRLCTKKKNVPPRNIDGDLIQCF